MAWTDGVHFLLKTEEKMKRKGGRKKINGIGSRVHDSVCCKALS